MKRYIPILGWLQSYQPGWARLDIIAGLTTAAVVIPKTMATSVIAGVPVQVGLYTALAPMLIYAVLGTSRPLSMSTTTTIGMLTATALARLEEGDPQAVAVAAAGLAAMVGLTLLLASFLRLGAVANLISDPVLAGFKTGLGLAIVVDQLPKLLGIHFHKASFLKNVASLVRHMPETSLATLAAGAGTLILIFLLARFLPKLPGPLIAVAGGIAASAMLDLARRGVEVVGHMPPGLPGFRVPELAMLEELWPAAIGIALMSFTESIAVGRAFVTKDEPRPDPNQELRALGLANIAGSLFHAMPAGGGTSETAVNRRAGARTQVSELVTVAIAVLAVLFLAPLISLMPQATLAAVVVSTTAGLIKIKEMRSILKIRGMEFSWAVCAAIGVVLLGTLKGILVAIVVSVVAMAYDAYHCPVYAVGRKRGTDVFRKLSPEHPGDETIEGLLIVRTEGRIHFANAQGLADKLWPLIRQSQPKVLVLDCSAVTDLEYTALRMLTDGEETLRTQHITLWLAALNPATLAVIRRSPLGEILGRERMFFDLAQAVTRYRTLYGQASAV
ncbi:MAG TPA: SulP family inorganic anion transporter [Candidatus Acidoferrales bacterium]|nr:SulP family inorganic anion transporter [Candidatus Acidoferrales bacterium]